MNQLSSKFPSTQNYYMKMIFITIVVFTVVLNGNAQIAFEEGYIIKNNNQKINCLIKNKDWKNNPSQFQYKTSIDSDVYIGKLDSIKEFSVNNKLKYIRSKVKIDKSSNNLKK